MSALRPVDLRVSMPLVASAAWLLLHLASGPMALAADGEAEGILIANGETIELPYGYVWREDEGFYDPEDPTWTILFLEHPVEERELDGMFFDSAWVRVGLTETAEFGEEPALHVLSQSFKLSADAGGNTSGGEDPEIEIESTGPDRFVGRIHHPEPQEILDDTIRYDLRFDLAFSDLDAPPAGEPLPAGGGEAGQAYVAWVEAIHSGSPERLAKLVPPEMAAQLEGEEAREQVAMMADLTPQDVSILAGFIDGSQVVLEVEGSFEGERVTGEVTLERHGDFWIPVSSSW